MRSALLGLWARPLLLLGLPPAFWAGNLVLGRALGPVFPPVTLAIGRWAVALAVLAPFVWQQVWRERSQLAEHWPLVFACGVFGIAGYNALGYVALQTVPATSVGLMNSTLPLMVALVGACLRVERLTVGVVLGSVLSLVGVAWIAARGDAGGLARLNFNSGELVVLLAVANYALYTVLLRRKPASISAPVFLASSIAAGLFALLPFWTFELVRGARIPTDPASILALLYIGIFASLLALIFWNRCVSMLGATLTGLSFHLVAVFTALFALVFLGEPVRGFHLVGMALILCGIFVTRLRTG